MKRPGLKWTVAIAASLALHASAAVLLARWEDETQIAGGASVEVALLGNAFETLSAAGEISDTAEPVPAEEPLAPVQADSTVEARPAVERPVSQAVERVQPAAPESQPAEAAGARSPEAEIASRAPAVTDDAIISLNSAEAASAAEPDRAEAVESERAASAEAEVVRGEEMSEVAAEMAALEEVPLPTARPEPPRVERRTAEAAPKQPAPARKQTGSGGRQQADSRRGVAQGRASGRSASSNDSSRSAPRQAGNAALSNYPGKVASKLRRALRYPREAKRERLRGEVHVAFVVSGNGHVGSVRVVRSSGADVLDRAAVEAVQRAAPFPPIPPEAGRSSWPFTVPLAFTR